MKLITAYIQPFMAEKVTDALRTAKVHGVTVLPCQGFGRITEDKSPHYMEEAAALGFAARLKSKSSVVMPIRSALSPPFVNTPTLATMAMARYSSLILVRQ